MSDFDDVDFFTDKALIADPYPYFEALRQKCVVEPEALSCFLSFKAFRSS